MTTNDVGERTLGQVLGVHAFADSNFDPPPQKERDLELAARIGQSLLKKNKTLSERNESLEEQVEIIREEVRTAPEVCGYPVCAVTREGLSPPHQSPRSCDLAHRYRSCDTSSP